MRDGTDPTVTGCADGDDGLIPSGAESPTAVFAGGGTGGHLYPALALADALAQLRPELQSWFVGADRGIEARVLPKTGRNYVLLPVRGLARGEGLRNWRAIPALVDSLWKVRRLFKTLRPGLVVVTGGYASAPAGLMGVFQGVPLALQEQNAVPGLTTRLLSRWARQIHLAFPEAAEHLPEKARGRVLHSGNPVQPPIETRPADARRAFGLGPDGTVVLVIGGSQGSLALNKVVSDAVRGVQEGRLIRPGGLQILWSTGPDHLDMVLKEFGGDVPPWVRATGYIDDMPGALAAADLAVSRAGAMATSELLAWGLPMILVPLPTAAADHQTRNARALESAGAAVYLPEKGLTGEGLWAVVKGLAGDTTRLEAHRRAARLRGRPDAARRIAACLDELLRASGSREAA